MSITKLSITYCSCGLRVYEKWIEYHKTTRKHKERIYLFNEMKYGSSGSKKISWETFSRVSEDIPALPLELCLMMSDEHF
jgi:hypothetical protein